MILILLFVIYAVSEQKDTNSVQSGKRSTNDTPASAVNREADAVASRERAERAAQEKKDQEARCVLDLHCLGEKFSAESTIKCRPVVERLAKNNFEWTDRWYEPKFSHYRWRDQKNQVITYIGDRIKFQNGFGAWILSTYECDFDTKTQTVLDARAFAGQLPR